MRPEDNVRRTGGTQGSAAGAFAGFPLSKVFVVATAEVAGGQATSVYASFGPLGNRNYAVIVMVPQSAGELLEVLTVIGGRIGLDGLARVGGRPPAGRLTCGGCARRC